MAFVKRAETTLSTRRRESRPSWESFRSDRFHESLPGLWREQERLAFAPTFDVSETKDKYILTAPLPGFKEQDLDISVSGNRLIISGRRCAEDVDDGACSERTYGSFTRGFTLPEGTNSDRIEAHWKDGVLSLRVPKALEAPSRRIGIRKVETGSAPDDPVKDEH
jgi:HSP20 family protein